MHSLFNYFKSAPPFTTWQSHPKAKSRILITAGVDGDEYAGIEAAHKLIKTYNLNIPITIIPIVNLAGYWAKTSFNPLDYRYPKHIYPGSPIGSSSSRLRYQLSKYTKGVDLWIDLHGGAAGEHLPTPFIWASDPYPFLSHLNGRILVESSIRKNIPYIMLEAGELGQVDTKSVNIHISWIYTILNNLDESEKQNWEPTYTKVKYDKFMHQPTTKDTLWWSDSEYVTAC